MRVLQLLITKVTITTIVLSLNLQLDDVGCPGCFRCPITSPADELEVQHSPSSREKRQLSLCDPCPCCWSEWRSVGSCSKTCGDGTITQTRTYEGTCIGPSSRTVACKTLCCPADCLWSAWSPWGGCSTSCGSGTRQRIRGKVRVEQCGGSCLGGTTGSQTCNMNPNSVDCELTNWTAFSDCSVTCGGGHSTRTRSIRIHPSSCGLPCDNTRSETKICNTQCCPVNCLWSAWSPWGGCSVSCRSGIRQRLRIKAGAEKCGGSCPGRTIDSQNCSMDPSPVDCVLTIWTTFGECTTSCGGGKKTRTRSIITKPSACGAKCETALSETDVCNTNCCPVGCKWATWEPWGQCTAVCGGRASRSRHRQKLTEASCGGVKCTGASTNTEACESTQPCPESTSTTVSGQLNAKKDTVKGGLGLTAIIGIGVGGFVLVVLIVAVSIVVVVVKRRIAQKKTETSEESQSSERNGKVGQDIYDDLVERTEENHTYARAAYEREKEGVVDDEGKINECEYEEISVPVADSTLCPKHPGE